MSTAIPESRLRDMRQTARSRPTPRFVNPADIYALERILDRRGEGWAASVLGRDLSRRAIAVPSRPYIAAHELAVLLQADVEEDRARFDAIVDAEGSDQ